MVSSMPNSFDSLKNVLRRAPVLATPDFSKPFKNIKRAN